MDKLDELKNNFLSELQAEREKCQDKAVELMKDSRSDEGNFEKIKANVFDIFMTLFQAEEKKLAAGKNEEGSEDKFELFCNSYMKNFDRLSLSWKNKLAFAKEHDLVAEIAVEEIKLETWSLIRELFKKNVEGIYDRGTGNSVI